MPAALQAWKEQGKTLAVFSSGSVGAQKLFFGHASVDGGDAVDLNSLFGGRNFDTVNAGAKGVEASYGRIAGEVGVRVGEVLFLSDNVTGELCFPSVPFNRLDRV